MIGRRRFLVFVGGAATVSCSNKSMPACATQGAGAGLGYCLVERKQIRIPNAGALAVGHAMLMAIDDSSAAIVARDDRGFYALSATCPHACCTVTLCSDAVCAAPVLSPNDCMPPATSLLNKSGAAFLCPCHGSQFDASGAVVSGPASNPLPAVRVMMDGRDALVDLSVLAQASDRS